MKCPYCGREMSLGCLMNWQQPVQWIPDGEKPSGIAYTLAASAVELEETRSIWKGYRAPAHYCETCKLVLAKTK